MRRKLFASAATFVMLACCLVAPSFSQKKGGRVIRPKPRPPGVVMGQRLTAAVSIKNFEFQPKTLTVKPGTIVTWTNDAGSHTVVADDDSFSSPTLGAGQTFSHKFARKGTYRYHCSFHGGAGGQDMAGTVVVQP